MMMLIGITVSGVLCAGTSTRTCLIPFSPMKLLNSELSFLSLTSVL